MGRVWRASVQAQSVGNIRNSKSMCQIDTTNSDFRVRPGKQNAQLQDQFFGGRQIAFMICEFFRVTGTDGTVLDYADLFPITFRDDDVPEFDTRWDEILLSLSKFPTDNVLKSLCKSRTRESDQLKTVLELYELNSSEDNEARLSEAESPKL